MNLAEQRAALKRRLGWFIWDQSSEEERSRIMAKDYNTLVLHPERNIIIELGETVTDLQDNFDWTKDDVLEWIEGFDRKPEVII